MAEQKSGAAGQMDWFSVVSGSVTTHTPIAFAAIGTHQPAPSCLAVTPDNARLYIGLQGTNEFAVLTVGGTTPTVLLLPNAAIPSATVGASSPNGVIIPPLATLSNTGFRVFFTSVNGTNGEVDIIDDNKGTTAPMQDAATPSLSFGASSTPQGIANIPIPTAP